ncbi:NAD(P)H-dependent oxidoreductase [Roseateles sp. P5_E11]
MTMEMLAEGSTGTALILYAHPEPALSFNAAMRDAASRQLAELGYEVVVEDLYQRGFAAVAGAGDFTSLTDAPRFGLVHEQRHAHPTGAYAADILRAQSLILAADLIVLQFPYWWYGPPAILKGWIDRVLTHGFAYTDDYLFDTGLLAGRRAMVAMTTGGSREELAADSGTTGSVENNLKPITGGVLGFVGMDVLPSFVAYSPASLSQAGREALLDEFRLHLRRELAPQVAQAL